MLRVGLNGFGRIGRALFRINELRKTCEFVVVNDIDELVANHAYLLKYDSIRGRLAAECTVDAERRQLCVDGKPVQFCSFPRVGDVPWQRWDVDLVIDASGVDSAPALADLVAREVIRQAIVTHVPRRGTDACVVFGANESRGAKAPVVSAGICDGNAVAPVLAILDEAFGIAGGFVTTLHPWLSYQNLTDGSVRTIANPGHTWDDFALGRAATMSLIPKPTTLTFALEQVLPDIASRIQAMSFRVPTGVVAAADLTLNLRRPATADAINQLFADASRRMPRVLGFQDDPLVSIDFAGTEQSVWVDGRWTTVNPDGGLKMVLWYDNEWGYSHRVLDLVEVLR